MVCDLCEGKKIQRYRTKEKVPHKNVIKVWNQSTERRKMVYKLLKTTITKQNVLTFSKNYAFYSLTGKKNKIERNLQRMGHRVWSHLCLKQTQP